MFWVLQDRYKHRGSKNFWSVYGGHFAKNGFVTPYCRKGDRLIRICGNSDVHQTGSRPLGANLSGQKRSGTVEKWLNR